MKIKKLDELLKLRQELKQSGKKLVLCHGHFNVIHPGHLRILNFAKQQGHYLVVSVLNDNEIAASMRDDFFSQEDRLQGVASLQMVDAVYALPKTVLEFINEIKPDFYVKGREFEGSKVTAVETEFETVKNNGGEVVFSSGEVQYSVPRIFGEDFTKSSSSNKANFLAVCKKHQIDFDTILKKVDHFSNLNFLVIGDTIVDQFVGCDMLGVSSEAPVLAIRELAAKEFIGGAAIVAHHVKSLGAQCTFISVVGKDQPADFVREGFAHAGINYYLLEDKERPTSFKIRYMVDNQKLLRVSRLKQHEISSGLEKQILSQLDELVPHVQGIIISDFVYGVVTKKIIEKIQTLAKKHNVKVFGDLQCSSQVGDVSRFEKIELITPTEKEARIAMADYTSGLEKLAHNLLKKTANKNLVITLGAEGLLAYSNNPDLVVSEFFPALETNPVDVAGAGDSMLSAYALALSSGLDILQASALGACVAAISVNRIGNIPITRSEVFKYIEDLKKIQRVM